MVMYGTVLCTVPPEGMQDMCVRCVLVVVSGVYTLNTLPYGLEFLNESEKANIGEYWRD